MNPTISVVMAVYNGEKYLQESIESILRQDFTDFELIIIDDGSNDRTSEILDQNSDPRIVRCKNPENKGLIHSLNLGLSIAQGKYIARMDADDVALPNRFSSQVKYLEEHPEIDILGTQITFVDDTLRNVIYEFEYPQTHGSIQWFLQFVCPIPHPTVMVRKEVYSETGGYDPDFRNAEDYELWTRAIKSAKAANLPFSTLLYRRHSNTVSVIANSIQRQNAQRIRQKYLKRLLNRDVDLEDIQWLDQMDQVEKLTPDQVDKAINLILEWYRMFITNQWLTDEEDHIVREQILRTIHTLLPEKIVSSGEPQIVTRIEYQTIPAEITAEDIIQYTKRKIPTPIKTTVKKFLGK